MIQLNSGEIVNIPMKVVSVEEVKTDNFNRFGTSKLKL